MSLAAVDLSNQSGWDSDLDIESWIPAEFEAYLIHVCQGVSIRAIARDRGCHASTVLRQVRKVEQARDCILIDAALDGLAEAYSRVSYPFVPECNSMSAVLKSLPTPDSDINREARRILRRLCESKSFLLVSPELEKAAVFRETVPGRRTRTAVVERDVAQAFAVKDWIEGKPMGKVAIYTITQAGRSALKRLIAEDKQGRAEAPTGFAERPSPFQLQHREYGEREVMEADGQRKVRYNLAESPLTALARKKSKDGTPYLPAELIQAGDRLREDFELAQMGPRIAQNWDNFLTSSCDGSYGGGRGPAEGPQAARDRVANALEAMGTGLADIAFRCCCFLEGLETAEKRLGWSARSGKVVLKIALQRLAAHYEGLNDPRLIG